MRFRIAAARSSYRIVVLSFDQRGINAAAPRGQPCPPLFPLTTPSAEVYSSPSFTMIRDRIHLGKILVTAIAFLLLCGIVGGEFPELQSLTDNPTNDFTVVRTKLTASPVLLLHSNARRPAAALHARIPADILLSSRFGPLQPSAAIPPERSALYSVLRT